MSQGDYTSEFLVSQTPEAVYETIVAVRGWWGGEIEGRAEQVGDVFSYRYEDLHFTRHRVSELVPGRRVAWHVEDGEISFVANHGEWDGTDIVFDMTAQDDGGSLVRITHKGLDPEKECFEACSGGWNHYFGECLKAAIESARPADGHPQADALGGGSDALAASIDLARAGLNSQRQI